MCAHHDGERRRIPRPCAPTPAAIPIAPLYRRGSRAGVASLRYSRTGSAPAQASFFVRYLPVILGPFATFAVAAGKA
jgi:hypothetical protein